MPSPQSTQSAYYPSPSFPARRLLTGPLVISIIRNASAAALTTTNVRALPQEPTPLQSYLCSEQAFELVVLGLRTQRGGRGGDVEWERMMQVIGKMDRNGNCSGSERDKSRGNEKSA